MPHPRTFTCRNLRLARCGAMVALPFLCISAAHAACQDLRHFPLRHGRITAAVDVAAGAPIELSLLHVKLTAPAPLAFCRVAVTLTPTPDSAIEAEVWLPEASRWNGKFLGSGNGGFGGSLEVPELDMRMALTKGYATAGDDLGHETKRLVDATWAIGHPEKVKDFAYRADHVTAEFAKKLIPAYYGQPARLSYFRGCSYGGHEALMEAQRFPADYDGIIAGAPVISVTHSMVGFLWNERALHAEPGSEIPEAKLKIIQKAVLARCDRLDGIKDGIIDAQMSCHFDPAVLTCKRGDAPDCLTPAQVTALRKIYGGPLDPDTGRSIYPGFAPGYEALPGNWSVWITGPEAAQAQFANQFFGSFIYSNPKWNFHSFDFGRDVRRVDAEIGPLINSNNPDLRAFAARGGKLILFQGWADAAVTPWGTLKYYRAIQRRMGKAETQRFVRLFMVPGMMHCGGGPGPSSFDTIAAMEQWREHDRPPAMMIASRYAEPFAARAGLPGRVLATRPICAYPAERHWTGKGSYDDAHNYVCRVPHRD
jgi:hypothetical protein